MIQWLFAANSVLLLTFVAMYFGTGWSLVLFSFPLEPKLTPETYALPFVEPVRNATRFFTFMTLAMIATAIVLVIGFAFWPVVTGIVLAYGYLLAPVLMPIVAPLARLLPARLKEALE